MRKKRLRRRFIGGVLLITVQEDAKWKQSLQEAINRAKRLSTSVLFSVVERVDRVDPLSFFANGRERFFGERFFWKNPSDETTIVGFGICETIRTDEKERRFHHVERAWQSRLEQAVIANRYEETGIGPLLFGGFSFDPHKRRTKLWEHFAHSHFQLPRFMYTEKNGRAYLTMNVLLSGDDDETVVERLEEEKKRLIETALERPLFSPNRLLAQVEVDRERWKETVAAIVSELKASALKKVVLARELRLSYEAPIACEPVLFRLCEQQQHCIIFALESKQDCFIGATPERLIKKDGRLLTTACVAGSIRRGETEDEDVRLGEALLNDEKNRVEHQYVVDMIREAIGPYCDELTLPDRPTLLKTRDIQHLYTPVVAMAKPEASLLLFVDRLHPTPALGGYPKEEAVEKIRNVETLERGLYGSPLGWLDFEGNGDFVVAIRSGLIQGNDVSLFAGCGVVEHSHVESEYEETNVKFRPMLSALGGL